MAEQDFKAQIDALTQKFIEGDLTVAELADEVKTLHDKQGQAAPAAAAPAAPTAAQASANGQGQPAQPAAAQGNGRQSQTVAQRQAAKRDERRQELFTKFIGDRLETKDAKPFNDYFFKRVHERWAEGDDRAHASIYSEHEFSLLMEELAKEGKFAMKAAPAAASDAAADQDKKDTKAAAGGEPALGGEAPVDANGEVVPTKAEEEVLQKMEKGQTVEEDDLRHVFSLQRRFEKTTKPESPIFIPEPPGRQNTTPMVQVPQTMYPVSF